MRARPAAKRPQRLPRTEEAWRRAASAARIVQAGEERCQWHVLLPRCLRHGQHVRHRSASPIGPGLEAQLSQDDRIAQVPLRLVVVGGQPRDVEEGEHLPLEVPDAMLKPCDAGVYRELLVGGQPAEPDPDAVPSPPVLAVLRALPIVVDGHERHQEPLGERPTLDVHQLARFPPQVGPAVLVVEALHVPVHRVEVGDRDARDLERRAAERDPVADVQAELIAAYDNCLAFLDAQVGRLLDGLKRITILDDTLVYYIIGDNGSSAEGGMNGLYNEYTYFNGQHEKVEDILPGIS